MSTAIHILLQLTIDEPNRDAWRALMTDMVAATASEAGTVVYQWYADAEGGTWHIHERYADRDACDRHVDGFIVHFGERFLGLAAAVDVIVYGNPSTKVRDILAGLQPRYFDLVGGFERLQGS